MNYYTKQKNHAAKVTVLSIALIGAFVAYDFFIASATTPLSAQTQTSSREQLLSVFDRIDALKIDTSIVSDQTFLSLEDFSVEPTPQQIGKANPFAQSSAAPVAPKTTAKKTGR